MSDYERPDGVPFDPDALADRLDALLPPDQFGLGDDWDADFADPDPLLEVAARLAAAPSLAPSPDALARISARVEAAIEANPAVKDAAPQPTRAPRIVRWPALLLAAAAAGALALLVIGRLLAPTESDPDIAALATETATQTITGGVTETPTASPTAPLAETATATMTLTEARSATATTTEVIATPAIVVPDRASATPTPISEPASATPELPAPASPTREPTPTITPTPLPGNLILEGQVSAIEGNTVDVYGILLVLDADDPLLQVLRVDDTVRVEGSFSQRDGTLIVEVFTLDLIDEDGAGIDVAINPQDPRQVWRDSGTCDNPPPSWAPANGWRARCENRGGDNASPGRPPGNQGGGRGGGNNNDDDDDDDGRGRGNDDDD